MFAEQIRRAIVATPRGRLAELSAAVWKGYAAGAIGEAEAQGLAEEIEARKALPPVSRPPRRRVGSRPRSPESLERRRRWVASGLMPPQIAACFTMGEGAVLAVIAAEFSKRGLCRLTIGHIAALAGVCRQTVRNAVRQAEALGLLKSEEWRLTAWRNAPNTVRILSPEWLSWLRLGRKTAQGRGRRADREGGSKTVERTPTELNPIGSNEGNSGKEAGRRPAGYARTPLRRQQTAILALGASRQRRD